MAKNFYCPGFYENAIAYKRLFWFKKHYPDCFVDRANITHIYGCFPNCGWNGGSSWIQPPPPRAIMYDVFNWYKEQGIIIQLTFTNPVLKETDVYDRYANCILDIAVEVLGTDYLEVLVSSPILEKYIREKYPHINITKSIVGATGEEKTRTTVEDYVKLLDEYPRIVIPRKKVNDIDFIQNFPDELKDRVELLCTDACPIDCPRIFQHYTKLGAEQLWEDVAYMDVMCTGFSDDNPFHEATYRQYKITPLEVEAYEALGWSEFKLSGRISSCAAPLRLVTYLIKPEFQEDVFINIYFDMYGDSGLIPEFDFWSMPIP
jgi:hypothetical protein